MTTMRLTTGQAAVLANSLSWCSLDYAPSDEEIAALFAYTDRGVRPAPGSELYRGWLTYYTNPYKWIEPWEAGKINPPISPPAAWVYDAYFAPQGSWAWEGWMSVLSRFFWCYEWDGDDLRSRPLNAEEWARVRPAYAQAYGIAAYFHPERHSRSSVGRQV